MSLEESAKIYDDLVHGGKFRYRAEDKIAYYSIDENGVINLFRVNGSFGGLATNLKYCEEHLLPISEFRGQKH